MQVRTIVILGATSAIAVAYARRVANGKEVRFILVGRSQAALDQVRRDLVARGATSVETLAGEIGAPDQVTGLFDRIEALGGAIDQVVLAYGVMPDRDALSRNSDLLVDLYAVNLVSAAIWAERCAAFFVRQGHGHLVVIGSVAGDRARAGIIHYSATKSGLERIVEGLAHLHAAHKGIVFTLVKPGPVDTPMTDHMRKGGLLWSSPDDIARVMVAGIRRGAAVIYAPWYWRWVLFGIRALPRQVFNRLKL